jgi:CDP-glucose 4,6-dehydratase
MGTVNLLEAVRLVGGVRAVVNVTSDKCYENREWVWGYRETDAMGGYDPYSCSKGFSELITASFRNAFFNPDRYDLHQVGLASARAGNVIGGGDWAENRLVPDIMDFVDSLILHTVHKVLKSRQDGAVQLCIDIQKNNFAALSVGDILQYYLLPAALRNEFSESL